MMIKKILSIIISVSLIASAFSLGAYAVPSVAEISDAYVEYSPEVEITENEETAEVVTEKTPGPSPVLMSDSDLEEGEDFGTPLLWEGASLMAELSGDGTEASPYLISTANELKLVSSNVNSGVGSTAHYKLTADIDLGGAEWTPIGYYSALYGDSVAFCGVFDGDGHTVSNFKITKDSTVFLGLFGFVVGGKIRNLNIDNFQINVTSTRASKMYAGAVAGRMAATAPGSHAVIEYCNVTNFSIKMVSNGTIFAGGIAGSVISYEYKTCSVFIGFSNAECDINVSSLAKNMDGTEPHSATAGGLVAFASALVSSTTTITDCGTKATIYAHTLSAEAARPLIGGAFGNVRTVDTGVGGTINISRCYSEGSVLAETNFYNYIAGGFAGQFYASRNLVVTDCYSSSPVTGKFLQAGAGCGQDPTAGGFVGQVHFPYYYASYGQTVRNCYASGNIAELTHTDTTPLDYSFVGGFTGYSSAPAIFGNCYRFEAQSVIGSDILEVDYAGIIALSDEDSRLPEKYVGFDMENVWEMDTDAEYFYPTLIEKVKVVKFIHDTVSFATASFNVGEKVSKPVKNPSKTSTVDKVFSFSHWSLTPDGEAFDFENTYLYENTELYAVFNAIVRNYTVSFVNEGEVYFSHKLGYNSPVTPPSGTPEKAETNTYYYTFHHWSDTEGGEEYDFNNCTVVGNMTFYAVYTATDKTAWTGGIAEGFTSGYGTEAMPYIISTGNELALLAKLINDGSEGYVNAHYALANNIHLGSGYWIPIGDSADTPFSGSFDGRGYTISHYTLSEHEYTGLFGYVFNGTVKNLAVRDFSINLAPTTSLGFEKMYVGAIAGYISSKNGEGTISCVSVSDGEMSINGQIKRLYAGGIIGYGISNTSGKTLITDSYAANSITAVNSGGYNYLGGIAGELNTGSSSLSQILRCYSFGTLDSESYNSSRAGGLVGYLYSHGSAYFPTEETQNNDGANLLESDEDIMIKDSFAITSAYSLSTNYTSYAGRIVAERNTHGGVENVFSPRGAGVVIEAKQVSTTLDVEENTTGASTDLANLKSMSYLSTSRGFDFDNIWTFTSDYDYPVLKFMVVDKPLLRLIDTSLSDGTLDITLQLMSEYTLVIGIYNQRNQLIKFERINYSNTAETEELVLSYDNMEKAYSVSVSAYNNAAFTPMFETINVII